MPLPFALQASAGCPSHADLALALAAEFTAVDTQAADEAFDALAAGLAGARTLPEDEQLTALTGVVGAFATAEAHADPDLLMVDRVLERFAGHPTAIAVVACEAGRRAGLDVGVIGDGRRHLLAHRVHDEAVALDPVRRGATAGEDDCCGMSWRCSHQVSFALLRELVDVSLRCGRVGDAIRATELELVLPLDEPALDHLRRQLAGLRARLN